MKARRLQELRCRFEISGALFERPLMIKTLDSCWTCLSWSVFLRRHHGWIHGEILSVKTWKWWRKLFFFWTLSSMGWPMCVVRAHSCSQKWLKPQLFWCRKLPFAFSQRWGVINSSGYCTRESSLLFLVGFIVIVKGLYASVASDFHNIWAFNVRFLQLADCCLSRTVIRELFVTFFKASTRHNCFHHVATGFFAHWLSFEPDVVIQSSVSFDTKVEWTRPLHV